MLFVWNIPGGVWSSCGEQNKTLRDMYSMEESRCYRTRKKLLYVFICWIKDHRVRLWELCISLKKYDAERTDRYRQAYIHHRPCSTFLYLSLHRVVAVSWWQLTWTWPMQSSSSSTSCTAAWSHPATETRVCFWSTVWMEESTGTSWQRYSMICTRSLGKLCFYRQDIDITNFTQLSDDKARYLWLYFCLCSGSWMYCCPLLLVRKECVCAGGSRNMKGQTTVTGPWITSSSQARTPEHRYLTHSVGWHCPIMRELLLMGPQEG